MGVRPSQVFFFFFTCLIIIKLIKPHQNCLFWISTHLSFLSFQNLCNFLLPPGFLPLTHLFSPEPYNNCINTSNRYSCVISLLRLEEENSCPNLKWVEKQSDIKIKTKHAIIWCRNKLFTRLCSPLIKLHCQPFLILFYFLKNHAFKVKVLPLGYENFHQIHEFDKVGEKVLLEEVMVKVCLIINMYECSSLVLLVCFRQSWHAWKGSEKCSRCGWKWWERKKNMKKNCVNCIDACQQMNSHLI